MKYTSPFLFIFAYIFSEILSSETSWKLYVEMRNCSDFLIRRNFFFLVIRLELIHLYKSQKKEKKMDSIFN